MNCFTLVYKKCTAYRYYYTLLVRLRLVRGNFELKIAVGISSIVEHLVLTFGNHLSYLFVHWGDLIYFVVGIY
jgi:hypothetical protein